MMICHSSFKNYFLRIPLLFLLLVRIEFESGLMLRFFLLARLIILVATL